MRTIDATDTFPALGKRLPRPDEAPKGVAPGNVTVRPGIIQRPDGTLATAPTSGSVAPPAAPAKPAAKPFTQPVFWPAWPIRIVGAACYFAPSALDLLGTLAAESEGGAPD